MAGQWASAEGPQGETLAEPGMETHNLIETGLERVPRCRAWRALTLNRAAPGANQDLPVLTLNCNWLSLGA